MKTKNKLVKGTFWSSFLFYFLIAFEFAYMAGPFAAFFYSAYAPVLRFFNEMPSLSWLNRFFLPHLAEETSSVLINSLERIGLFLAVFGFLAFLIGACQIYYSKIMKKGAVTKGIYNYIRHPQYISFMICSLGLLFIWPRYIVAIMFVTMLFVYYFLAKAEEKECSAKYGQSYIEYLNKTNMFLPFKLGIINKIKLPQSKPGKIVFMIFAYIGTLILVLTAAKMLETYSIKNLYSVCANNRIDIALNKLPDDEINRIMTIVNTDNRVASLTDKFDEETIFLNYIMPTSWFASEIPMNNAGRGHISPKNYDRNLYKIIVTKIHLRKENVESSEKMLVNVYKRIPVIEVWVNLEKESVIKILEIPDETAFEGIPLAVY